MGKVISESQGTKDKYKDTWQSCDLRCVLDVWETDGLSSCQERHRLEQWGEPSVRSWLRPMESRNFITPLARQIKVQITVLFCLQLERVQRQSWQAPKLLTLRPLCSHLCRLQLSSLAVVIPGPVYNTSASPSLCFYLSLEACRAVTLSWGFWNCTVLSLGVGLLSFFVLCI